MLETDSVLVKAELISKAECAPVKTYLRTGKICWVAAVRKPSQVKKKGETTPAGIKISEEGDVLEHRFFCNP